MPNNLSCIIKGCEINETQTSYIINEGIVLLNGEILHAPYQILSKYSNQNQIYYWDIDTEYYSDGYKLLQNGQNVQVWEKRWAYVAYGIPPQNYLPLFRAKYLLDYITQYSSQQLKNYVENQQYITSFYPGWTSNPIAPVRIYKDLLNRVHIAGRAVTSQNISLHIFN